ncbi:hypothetical protein SAM9427_36110 (plasmid) [Streptomyces sp. ETH9427]|nr:hypothetical protein SAM9427_36110 [Streptomyces sp. ETH9427]
MGNTFSQPTCSWCGNPRRIQATGRPGEYCSTRCRQAAHRHRHTAMEPPDTEEFDQALRVQLKQMEQAARTILEILTAADGAVSEPLQQMVRLQVLAEKLTPHMVARTKLRGATWDQIGALLGMTGDTARKKFSLPTRRAGQRSVPVGLPPTLVGPAAAVPAPPAGPACPMAPDGADVGGDGTDGQSPPSPTPAPAPCATPATGGRDLATVLSSLQRASGLSLRALASRASLSPSFLSRVMCGERFPSWKHTCSIARVCGADPEVLRRVWESSNARRDNQPRPSTLASALRFLHLRAGSPTPWAISVTSNNDLDEDYIAGLLQGTTIGPWEDIHRIVQILDGEPSFFFPLWEVEAFAQPVPQPTHQPPPARAPAREEPPPSSARIEDLLTAFSDALRSPRRTTPRRRVIATPIPSVTRWNGR